MVTRHTPGPWEVHYPIRSNERLRIKTTAKQEIATVAKVSGGIEELTYNANARLIAAAPELLEALRDLHGEIFARLNSLGYSGDKQLHLTLQRADDAMSKAVQS